VGQYELLQKSVHGKLAADGKSRIVQCTTCHGAHGIVAVKNPRSPVHPRNLVATCARCHSDASYMRSYNPALPVDQREKYVTSVHGKRNAAGDVRVAECASCHGSHGILAVKDVRSSVYPTNLPGTCAKCHSDAAFMKSYGIPTNQYELYAKSVHGVALLERNDLGAPACNSCHGNHGATPPGVGSISKVCGTCHVLNSELFSASPHKSAFDALNVPECESCHGNHGIVAATAALIGDAPGTTCTRCHAAGSEGFAEAGVMRRLIDSLETSEEKAKQLVGEAEQKGMEIGEAKFRLREIRQARLESRTTVHAVNREKLQAVVGKGLGVAAWVSGEGERAIDDYYFRRVGLGVSTLIITFLAVTLYLYIRRLEKKQHQKESITS
jgi:DnaJ-class molecular chaperone